MPTQPPLSFDLLRRDIREYWPLWLIVAAAVILRIYEIGRVPGAIGDEAWYGVQAQQWLAGTGGELRTPTGNVSGLIQMGSLVLLHSLVQPSTLLLRIPALLTSLAAMSVAYAIGRRFFGPASGMAALVLVAAMPINIAYARLGWDPSHTPLLVLAAAYATFAGRALLGALLFAFALTNHPAAVFAAPFLTFAFLGFQLDRAPWRSALSGTVAFAAMLLVALFFGFQVSSNASHFLKPSAMVARLLDPAQWIDFALGFCRLLSGDTIYTFIAGQGFGAWRFWIDIAVALSLIATFVQGLNLARRDWRIAAILSGWLTSLLMMFIVIGPMAVWPVFERFSIATVTLTVLTIAIIVGQSLADRRRKPLLQASLAALAVPLLLGFVAFYLHPLLTGQNRPNSVYWVGVPELNDAAADRIAANRAGEPATIIAEDWWIYWPVIYRLDDRMLRGTDERGEVLLDRVPPGLNYWISYRGSRLDQQLAERSGFSLLQSVKTRDGQNALNIRSHGCRGDEASPNCTPSRPLSPSP